MTNQNSNKTHCIRGHELSSENVYLTKAGKRNCKMCVKLRKPKVVGPGRGRKKLTHCLRGHEYTSENTYVFPNGKGRTCRTCLRFRNARWNKNNPEKAEASRIKQVEKGSFKKYRKKWEAKNPIYYRVRNLKNSNFTTENFSNMLQAQKGLCAICAEKMDKPCLDHCHDTGKIRELLCGTCNTGIGHLRESTTILESAIAYLRKHKTEL